MHLDVFRITKDNGVMFVAPAQTPLSNYTEIGMGRLFFYNAKQLNLLYYE